MKRSERARVLIVDEEANGARGLATFLGGLGYAAEIAPGGPAALEVFSGSGFDVVITDVRTPGPEGTDLLEAIRAADPFVQVLVTMDFGPLDRAVDAIKRGAFHVLSKPLKMEEVRVFLERAVERRRLERSKSRLQKDAEERYGFDALVGRSEKMRRVFDLVDRVAEGTASVLITGESGTGKELIARALHYGGPRRRAPFVLMNCTAIPAALLESELFGHEKGAFTGASRPRAGLAVEAAGGTLFLDEIGDLGVELQPKLLRLLQEGEVRPVGSDKTRHVDVRVVAATHTDLEVRIKEGKFRNDLYYRLNVVPIHLPPLRERREDIPMLAERLLARVRTQNPHLTARHLSQDAQDVFMEHDWPGNVRELGNAIERAATLCVDDLITAEHVAFLGRRLDPSLPAEFIRGMPTLRELETRYIDHVLRHVDQNKVQAAAILGVDPSTLYRRQKRR